MKVLYDDNEKQILRAIYDQHPNAHLFDDSDLERVYSINFKVTDPGVAQYILRGMLFDKLEDFDMGIKIMSINFAPYVGNYELKQKLHDAIDDILG